VSEQRGRAVGTNEMNGRDTCTGTCPSVRARFPATDHSKSNSHFIRTCRPLFTDGQRDGFLVSRERVMMLLRLQNVSSRCLIISPSSPTLRYKEVVVIFLLANVARREFLVSLIQGIVPHSNESVSKKRQDRTVRTVRRRRRMLQHTASSLMQKQTLPAARGEEVTCVSPRPVHTHSPVQSLHKQPFERQSLCLQIGSASIRQI
jgi:hypothetical protein